MATTESTPAASADVTQLSKSSENKEKVTKVDKPDDEKYKRDLSEADKQLSALQEKMTALRVKIDGSSGKGPNSTRLSELRSQLDSIKEKQAVLKSGKSGIQQQLDAVKTKIEREQNELKAKRGKINYRSTDEIDREIKFKIPSEFAKADKYRTLEGEVDSGKLKLVDEKKNLKRISDLKSLRKQMSIFTVAEESIKSDISKRKALQDELSSTTQTPEAKALSEEFNRIREEMTKLKGENDEMFAKRGELKTQREELQKARDKAYEHKKMVQDEYFKQRDAFRAWNEHNRKAQSEKYWKQREDEERQRLEHNASIRLEEASHDAFASDIWKCENLLRLFGGSEGLSSSSEPKSPTATVPAAPAARTVETTGLTKLTSKKDREADDFLFGASSKKKQPKSKPTTPKTTGKSKGFVLSMDVMKTLGELGVALPTSDENVKTTVEELKTKLTYFKENQVRVTQENIAKAKKDNDDIERKQLATFFEKKEADLSGKKNRGSGGKKPATDRKTGKGKVNGNHSETKVEDTVENGEKETTPDAE